MDGTVPGMQRVEYICGGAGNCFGRTNRKLTAIRREEPTLLSKVSRENNCRISTEIQEFDRVLGGGIVSRFDGAGRRGPGNREVHVTASDVFAFGFEKS